MIFFFRNVYDLATMRHISHLATVTSYNDLDGKFWWNPNSGYHMQQALIVFSVNLMLSYAAVLLVVFIVILYVFII